MEVVLTVITPEDDLLHYPRIGAALIEYIEQVVKNNMDGWNRVSDLGCTGKNVFTASNGVIINEERIK